MKWLMIVDDENHDQERMLLKVMTMDGHLSLKAGIRIAIITGSRMLRSKNLMRFAECFWTLLIECD